MLQSLYFCSKRMQTSKFVRGVPKLQAFERAILSLDETELGSIKAQFFQHLIIIQLARNRPKTKQNAIKLHEATLSRNPNLHSFL